MPKGIYKHKSGESSSHHIHGMSGERFWSIWRGIQQRTKDKNFPKYKSYGGRGVKCEWRSYQDFKRDMYPKYLKKSDEIGEWNVSIERTDNDGNYCKRNCEWIHLKDQAKNRRDSSLAEYNGEKVRVAEIEKMYGIGRGCFRHHKKKGWSDEQVINYFKNKYGK